MGRIDSNQHKSLVNPKGKPKGNPGCDFGVKKVAHKKVALPVLEYCVDFLILFQATKSMEQMRWRRDSCGCGATAILGTLR